MPWVENFPFWGNIAEPKSWAQFNSEMRVNNMASDLTTTSDQLVAAFEAYLAGFAVGPSVLGDDAGVALSHALAGFGGGGAVTVTWDDVEAKPEAFPPSPHTHVIDDVDGLDEVIATHETTTNKGVAGGYAPLDETARIPAVYIPGSIEDIIEEPTFADFPQPGLSGKIYVALDTNLSYRWGTTQYTEISASPGSTDAVPEGVVNLYYTDVRAAAAATTAFGTRVTAAESNITAIQTENTQMAADVVSNEQRVATVETTKLDTTVFTVHTNTLDNRLLFAAAPADQQSPFATPVTCTLLDSNRIPQIQGGQKWLAPGLGLITPIGGAQLVQDTQDPVAAFCFQWRYPAGPNVVAPPAINQGTPWPSSWAVQFDLYGSDSVEFIGFHYGGYFNLTIDGQRVWSVAQQITSAGTSNAPAAVSIKFDLPDDRFHRIRFYMSGMSLETVVTPESGTVLQRPIFSPRAYFLGDGITQGQTDGVGKEIGSWIYKFSEMCGIYDVWNDAWRGWGPITGGAANLPGRAAGVAQAAPNIVFLQGYDTDIAADPAAVATAFGQAVSVACAAPNKPLVFAIGSTPMSGVIDGRYSAIDAAIRPLCVANNVAWIEPSTSSVYAPDGTALVVGNQPWIVPTNRGSYTAPGTGGVITLSSLGQIFYAYNVYSAVRLLTN